VDASPAVVGMINSKTLIVSLIALGVSTASAQSAQKDTSSDNSRAVQPERPTVATHAFTVAPGFLEIETGGERDQFDARTTALNFPTVFKIGLAQRAQLSVNTPLTKPPGISAGLGDWSVGLKYRLTDDAPLLGAFAIQPSVKAATGDDMQGRGTGTTDISILAISSHKFAEYAMDLNVGYARHSDGMVPRSSTLWTASFGGPFAGSFGWVAECYGYPGTGGLFGQAPVVAVLGGPTFLAMESLAIDAGVTIPVHGPQPHAIYAGLVYNVGRIFQRR
jgi:hypothetical protein